MSALDKLLALGLKHAPQGVDAAAHSVSSYNELGKQVTDPLALAAHTNRGHSGYEAKSGDFSLLDNNELLKVAKFLDNYILDDNTSAQFREAKDVFKGKYHGALKDAIDVEVALGQAIGQDRQRKLMESSKITLTKPIYIMRKEGAFSDQASSNAASDQYTFSALVIDPLKPETYNKYLAPRNSLPAVVYKLPAGSKIYHPAGKADNNEVVVTKKTLYSAERAALHKDYTEAVKKGSPLFAVAGAAAGVNPKDAEAQGGPSVDTELTTKIQGMLGKGVKADVVRKALAQKYSPDEVSNLMYSALQPKIDKLKANGVPDETIRAALETKGIAGVPASTTQDQPAEASGAEVSSQLQSSDTAPQNSGAQHLPSEPQSQLPNADGSFDNPLPNPDGSFSTSDAPQAPPSPDDMIAKLQNIQFSYKELGSSLAGWTGMAPGLKAKAADMQATSNAVILQELQKHGVNAVGMTKYGEVEVQNSDGTVSTHDSTFIDSMLAAKYEVGSAIVEGAAGARLGASIGLPFGPAGAVAGAVAGGVIGSAVGAFTGRGSDILANAQDVQYEVSTTELLAKMQDAGIADLTLSALGTSAFQLVKGGSRVTGRSLAKAYDLFIAGNKAGAQQTLKDVFNLNDAQIIDLVSKWEKTTGQKVLSDSAKATGTLGVKDTNGVLQAVTETTPGAENFVAAATPGSKTGGALLSARIDTRAKDVTNAANSLTNDNVDVVVRAKLGKYTSDTKDFFDHIKTLGVDSMADSSYRFNFADTALLPAMRDAVKGIHNSALRKDFYHYMQRISELGTGEAVTKVIKDKGIKPTTKAAVRQETTATARIAKLELMQAKKAKLAKITKTRDTALAKAKALKTVKGRKAATARARAKYAQAKIDAEKAHLAKLTEVNTQHATKLAKASATPELKVSDVEAAHPYRGFENLLQLRKTINELRGDNRFASFANIQQMKTALASVDQEIKTAALKHMPEGKAWLSQWRLANTEYSKMKQLEQNVLYKALTSAKVSPSTAVKTITDSMSYTDPSTFMQVMGKLPTQTRKVVEGAVLKHLIAKHTIGFEAGKQALDFPTLAEDLRKIAMTQPEARDLKRTVVELASVFKNDPHLSAATGNVPLPKFQSYLTADPVMRAKYEIASTMFNAVRSRIPFSHNAGRAALVKNLGKLLDNPGNAKLTKDILRELPDDPELKTAIKQLAIQFTEKGVPEHYGKVPIYRVYKPGEANKSASTALGNGVLHYTDKAVADNIAKQTGAKVREVLQLHKTIATPEDVAKALGREPTKAELKDPEVLQLLQDKGLDGIAVGNKVLLFR